jgi:CRP-like cAMP-binding protein
MTMQVSAIRSDDTPDRSLPRFGYIGAERGCGGRGQQALYDDLRALDRFSARVRFAKNETIFSEGDKAGHAYKIVSGMVRLCTHTRDGRRQIADFLVPGAIFGIIDRGEYGFSAEAVSDVVMISYPRSQIDRLSATKPEVIDHIFAALTDQFMVMQRHLVVLGCQNAKERVASFLLMLADRCNAMPGDRIDLPMGRQDIASHLGLTIETVCRAITELKREGSVVVPTLNQIILKNLRALRMLAEGQHYC